MEEQPLKVLNELRINDIAIQKKYEKNNKDGRRILHYDIELTNTDYEITDHPIPESLAKESFLALQERTFLGGYNM